MNDDVETSEEPERWRWLPTRRLRMLALLSVEGSLTLEKENERWFARILRKDGAQQLSVVTDEEREQLERYLAGDLKEPPAPVVEPAVAVKPTASHDLPPARQLAAWLAGVVGAQFTGLTVYVDQGWQSVSFELRGAKDDSASPTIDVFDGEGRDSDRRRDELIVRLAPLLGDEPVLSAMRHLAADERTFQVRVLGPYGKLLWSCRIR